jgi:hypothetical protein
MKPHQERVVEEKKDLDGKIDRLKVFVGGETFNTLDEDEQDLLEEQLGIMHDYSRILGERIAGFKS